LCIYGDYYVAELLSNLNNNYEDIKEMSYVSDYRKEC
jgi:hypothetical protein